MSESTTPKEYNLEKDCELRFEIESKLQVVVEVNITTFKFNKKSRFNFIFSSGRDLRNFMEQSLLNQRNIHSRKVLKWLFSRIRDVF